MKVGGSDSGSHGVPVYDTGAPFAVPDRQVGDALEALEVAAVLDRVAGHAVGELGAAAVRSRRPSADLAWIRAELATVGQVAGLIRSADGVTAERVPDVARTLSRLRVEGSVLEGAEVVGLRQVLTASRLVAAELKRALRDAPLLVALARPVPDRTLERRSEERRVGKECRL